MPLKAGSKADYADSMANVMEQAFYKEWSSFMGSADKPDPSPQMQLLFVAIAQGVVEHLKAYHDSFHVKVNNGSDQYEGTVSDIDIV